VEFSLCATNYLFVSPPPNIYFRAENGFLETPMNFKMIALAGVAAGLLAAPAFGHHSFAMFDASTTVEYEGTVKEFQWTNPHSWLQVMVEDEAGEAVEWSLEMGSPGGLARNGWRPRTVVPGDEVTVTLHPLKDGSPGGQLLTVRLPNGELMGE
jgi:hypothetical protein